MLLVYADFGEASRGLLLDVARVLSSVDVRYVVMGGWCPVLRLKNERHPHPGTRDVDVLFEDGAIAGALRKVIETFLVNDYLLSAKHEFQLLRTLTVSERPFVFNVDLLHPGLASKKPEMFVDHLDLGVRVSEFAGTRPVTSVALPSAMLVFEHDLFGNIVVEGRMPSGAVTRLDVPIVDPSGMIVSKAESAMVKKRYRDAFDIYLALTGADRDATIARLSMLASRHTGVRKLLEGLVAFGRAEPARMNGNISRYFSSTLERTPEEGDPSAVVVRELTRALVG